MKKITAILILLALYIHAAAATITVNSDGTGDYTTIQAGIDAAVSGADTVEVALGTYYENIKFKGKNIIVTSSDPEHPANWVRLGSFGIIRVAKVWNPGR